MNYKPFLKLAKQSKSFLIVTHVNPDIDALASQLVVGFYLKSVGKKIYIINADPVPRMYSFLPGAGSIRALKPADGNLSCDVAVVVDCGDLGRVGSVQKIAQKAKTIVNIDHHVTNRRFADINFVNPAASSTSEMVFELLKAGRYRLNRKTALLLYLGIMTDTGSFRYDNTSAHTHAVISQLLGFKIPVNKLYQKIYETVPLNDLKMFTKIINSFEITHAGRVTSVSLRKKDINRFSGEFDLREKIFTFLRSIKGTEVIVILTEIKKDLTRINFRSQGNVDVAHIASLFNGGGHKKASGCQVGGSLKEARHQVFSSLNRILK
ncbi:MAG TPA: bifunctional oligoribonuclease/PAP phosphatase NrnA [Candidatus Omnitrophota bacterium]|nr:bifunctional oligoribonuclease/PAP phosphatase NrnA [Candidatus Omnitrophota bacterium]HPD85092.1 bifunctional oligoribonuclease/PAP phosphatase NrnA [Candidatus Omnitrophota bacterium]HRZ03950.1 bifunctional oligoribonuclease/PAP phosphatase NrnA [Candidatus Omnitrophota bacterium]